MSIRWANGCLELKCTECKIGSAGFDSARNPPQNAMQIRGTGTINHWARHLRLVIKDHWFRIWGRFPPDITFSGNVDQNCSDTL